MLDTYSLRFVRYRYPPFFFCLQDIIKMSWRHFWKATSRHVLKTTWRHVFKTSSRHAVKMSWRRLQCNNCLSFLQDVLRRFQDVLRDVFKTSSKRLCKTSSRRLGRPKILTLKTCWMRFQDMSWRSLQDVFKTNKCLLG